MSDNKCKSCGQWSGKNHKCPTLVMPVSPSSVPPVSNGGKDNGIEVSDRVARAQAALNAHERMYGDDPNSPWNVAEELETNSLLVDECRSVREGGQLCSRHAADNLLQAEMRHEEYLAEERFPDSRILTRLEDNLQNARIDYASTRAGADAMLADRARYRDQAVNATSIPEMQAAYRRVEEIDATLAAGFARKAANELVAERSRALGRNMNLNDEASYAFLKDHGFLDNSLHYGNVTPDNAGENVGQLLTLLPEDERSYVINRYGLKTGVPDPSDRISENFATPLFIARNTDRQNSVDPVKPDPYGRFQAYTPEANQYLAEKSEQTFTYVTERLGATGTITRDDIDRLTTEITDSAHGCYPEAGCTDTEPRMAVTNYLIKNFRHAGYDV